MDFRHVCAYRVKTMMFNIYLELHTYNMLNMFKDDKYLPITA